MKYLLLTGATGLLGSYLMKDLLAADMPVAVLTRRGIAESPRQRIEGILTRFEQRLARALPRPVVWQSDLNQPRLGLDQEAERWIARHVDVVLHNAASLSFEHDPATDEPFRSNVEGTRNVLDLCRRLGIARFHHVSTAYVCGLREGRVLESEFDEGQAFGNVYEESKLRAEKLVREAEFLQSPTIHRPAIIVGDSRDGYTPTFHGFYAPLKILHPFVDPNHMDDAVVAALMAALGMKEEDGKNFVPVDWVSAVIAHVVGDPALQGICYHLAPQQTVPMRETAGAMLEAFRRFRAPAAKPTLSVAGLESLANSFQDQMEVYRSYWRCDPTFDTTELRRAAPHLPCPILDRETLVKLAGFAIRCNFGWPRPKPTEMVFDSHAYFASRKESLALVDGSDAPSSDGLASIDLRITGHGGGDWTIEHQRGRPVSARVGLSGNGPSIRLRSDTFQQMADRGDAHGNAARGRIVFEGNADERAFGQAVIEAIAR